MPRGGARKGAGRKPKWNGKDTQQVRVPSFVVPFLEPTLEELIEKGVEDSEISEAIIALKNSSIRFYSSVVSAGAGSTSTASGNDIYSDCDRINLAQSLLPNPERSFIVSVVGDSMIDVGVYPGDWLIVEEINPLYERPNQGDIVIVSWNDEHMVKRYYQDGDVVVLESENKEHRPIRCNSGSVYVTGIVRNSIRRLGSKKSRLGKEKY